MSGSNSAERKRYEPLVLVETADLSEEDWLDYRRRGIGGSDVSAIFGTSPFRTARDLYYDKLNIASVEDDEGNWVAMEMGHLLEPLVAKIFERKTGYRVYQIKKMFQHPQYPWMLADVDYFVELPDGTTAILEIKTTNYNARDNWWMNGKETVPVYYESQGRHYMAVLTRMKDDGLLPALTGSFSEDAIAQACGQVETLQLQERLHIRKTKRIQEELVRVPNFAALYGALCRQEIGDEEIASVLESADGYGERLTAYPQEQVLAVMELELLPSLRFEYLKYYFPFVMYEEEEQVILDNLQTFPIAEWKGLSMLTEHQRDMMRQPFLGSYLFCWHQNERKALELLEQNRPLQRVCILLYRQGVRLFLSVERLKDLRWMKMTDVGKFRRLLAVFEYDAEDLSAFFDLWLDNHAGQYDLNWFISQPHPLSKERRKEILCNQLSYLNALYAGRLHLDFNAIRQFQFSILIYAVEHRKKHFLDLVDQNSEVFLSLGRYSLLFEPGFCEHCNINSLTLKNLKASDSVNRNDSFFTLLEEGQQYTFEEMYQLWHQKEVYVRLYTMLTPLPVDQRLLTLRQLIKRELVSQYTGDTELEQLGKCLLERPFSEWYVSTHQPCDMGAVWIHHAVCSYQSGKYTDCYDTLPQTRIFCSALCWYGEKAVTADSTV